MKIITLILAYAVILCAILLPIYAIWVCVKENYSWGINFYMATISSCFSCGVIYIVWKAVKEEYF